ncbi:MULTISPECIES: hypothetical protein [unclassified Microbacterium]|uniref:hypothetical protein n=1 Tax=unclassified Microbacterium TaxID=2609290 RepID=UPI0030176D32
MVEESGETTARPRSKAWIWVAAVAVVLIAVIVYFVVTSNSSGTAGPTTSPSASPSAPAQSGEPTDQPTPDPSETPGTLPELAPVAPGEPSDNGEGLVAQITAMKSVQGEAVQAGEIAGPAVQFTLKLTNGTGEAIDLGFIAVNAYIGEAMTPAGGLVKPGAAPFEGTLAPGKSAEGVYVYSIPENQRDDVTLTVDYRAGQPAFVFRGKVG